MNKSVVFFMVFTWSQQFPKVLTTNRKGDSIIKYIYGISPSIQHVYREQNLEADAIGQMSYEFCVDGKICSQGLFEIWLLDSLVTFCLLLEEFCFCLSLCFSTLFADDTCLFCGYIPVIGSYCCIVSISVWSLFGFW